jgi:hypothetical protein
MDSEKTRQGGGDWMAAADPALLEVARRTSTTRSPITLCTPRSRRDSRTRSSSMLSPNSRRWSIDTSNSGRRSSRIETGIECHPPSKTETGRRSLFVLGVAALPHEAEERTRARYRFEPERLNSRRPHLFPRVQILSRSCFMGQWIGIPRATSAAASSASATP